MARPMTTRDDASGPAGPWSSEYHTGRSGSDCVDGSEPGEEPREGAGRTRDRTAADGSLGGGRDLSGSSIYCNLASSAHPQRRARRVDSVSRRGPQHPLSSSNNPSPPLPASSHRPGVPGSSPLSSSVAQVARSGPRSMQATHTRPLKNGARRRRHHDQSRGQILRALAKASFVNGSQWAIVWVTAQGEPEVFGSEVFRDNLSTWFAGAGGIQQQAQQLVDADRYGCIARSQLVGADLVVCDGSGSVIMTVSQDEDGGFVEVDLGPEVDDAMEAVDVFGMFTAASVSTSIPNEWRPTISPSSLSLSALNIPTSPDYVPARMTRSISTYAINDADDIPVTISPQLSPSRSPSSRKVAAAAPATALQPVVFTPLSLTAWYADKLGALQQKAAKTVCREWIGVVEPQLLDPNAYDHGTSRPTWWPSTVRWKPSDSLVKVERLLLLASILRTTGVPIDDLERATSGPATALPVVKMVILSDVYKVAREEQAALQAAGGNAFEYMTVVLPVPLVDPLSPILDASPKSIRPRVRRSLTASIQAPEDDRRASTRPYPLARSHSVTDVYSSTVPSSRPLARSHSLSSHAMSPTSRSRRARVSLATQEEDRQVSFDQMREPRPPGQLFGSDTNFSAATPQLQPPIALQSHGSLYDQIEEPVTPSQPTAPTLHRSPTSQRLQMSPIERSRSSQQEPSFASPAMIKSRSRAVPGMGSIAESDGIPSSPGPAGKHDEREKVRQDAPLQVHVHPGHDFDPFMYRADYPTPSFPQTHQPTYHPPEFGVLPHASIPEHLSPQLHSSHNSLLHHATHYSTEQYLPPHDESQLQAQRMMDQHMAAQQQSDLLYADSHRHQAAFYYTPESSLDGSTSLPMAYSHQMGGYEYDTEMMHDGGQNVMMGHWPGAHDVDGDARKAAERRRYREHVYGVEA